MNDRWLVLKFGGSSVRGAAQWRAIAERVGERQGEGFRILLVCSAVQGVTDLLSELTRKPSEQGLVDLIVERHVRLAGELEIDASLWIEKARRRLQSLCQQLQNSSKPSLMAEVMALGEWLSTRLGWVYLQQRFETEWIDARGLLHSSADPDQSDRRQWLSADCKPGPDSALLAGLNACAPLVITQGFVIARPEGGTALLGRGGSDTSATLLGGRIGAQRVEIWTDVPGVFSSDPRRLADARLLRQLDYAEALEMAASGAGVIHARCIRAAAATQTPIWILDTASPGLEGTRIHGQVESFPGAKAVVCRTDMAVLLLQNIDPRQQVGFLAWVFATVAERGISIELVATSETTTTIALSLRDNHLVDADIERLAADLSKRCKVEVFVDCVAVNVVGRGVSKALQHLQPAYSGFEHYPLLMVSQSANDLCHSMLVRRGEETALLAAAHSALIANQQNAALFGPRWSELDIGQPLAAVGGGS